MLGNNTASARRRRILRLRAIELAVGDDVLPDTRSTLGEDNLFAEDFFEMCGTTPPLRLIVENDVTGEVSQFQLSQPYAVVGRSERCDIQLSGAEVSRRHVYLQVVNGCLFACDLASSTGTFWGDDNKHAGWLTSQQSVGIGPYRLRLPADAIGPNRTPQHLPTHRDEGDPSLKCAHPIYLEFANNRRGDRVWQVNRDLTLIGRSKSCKLQLGDPSLSDVHAAIVRTPAGAWIVDLLGNGGTYLAGKRVEYSSLADKQELRIGIFRLVVHFEAPRSRGAHLSK